MSIDVTRDCDGQNMYNQVKRINTTGSFDVFIVKLLR